MGAVITGPAYPPPSCKSELGLSERPLRARLALGLGASWSLNWGVGSEGEVLEAFKPCLLKDF